MYYILNDNIYPGLAIATLKQLLTMDWEKDISSNYFQGFSSENQYEPPLKRQRKHIVLNLTTEMLCKSLGMQNPLIENCADPNRSLYTVFIEQMLTFGEVIWHHHSQEKDVVILNDYDTSTGALLPSCFVHVTCVTEYSQQEQFLIKCSCEIYNITQTALIYKCLRKEKVTILF